MPPGFSLDHAPPPCSAEDIALPPYSTEEVTLLFCSTEDIAPLPCFAVCPLWLHLGLHGGRCSTFVLCLGCCAPPLGEQIAPHWCLVRGIMSPVSSAVGGAPKNPDQLGDVLSCTQEPPLEVAHKWGGGGFLSWLCQNWHWITLPISLNTSHDYVACSTDLSHLLMLISTPYKF